MPDWRIVRLSNQHDRSNFDCGHQSLDDWLRHRAGQFDRRDLARTFVALGTEDQIVRGYYALSNHRVDLSALPESEAKGLPRLDIPVVLLGRLAVDRTMQGRGLGADLLMDALRRVEHLSLQTGIRAVEVDAIDDSAGNFYLRYGFVPLRDDARHLFLPMQAIRKMQLPPLE